MKRGQAALEFLMTYGWALVAIIVVIGALAYFTGFYTKFTPDVCAVRPPFSCIEYKVSSTGNVLLGIQNGLGYDVQNVTVTLHCNQNNATRRTYAAGVVRGQARINTTFVRFNCPLDNKFQFRGTLFVDYGEPSSPYIHTVTGNIQSRVE